MPFSVEIDGKRDFHTSRETIVLLEYGLSNFFAFKEGAVVTFRFDGNTPEHITQGRQCSTIMGVNGANAAGKTHLLKGLDFIGWFGARSFNWKPGSKLPIEPYGESKEPSEFYAEFKNDEITYRYELSLTDDRVHREALYRTKVKRTPIFERIDNEIVSAKQEFDSLYTLSLRSNASVISTVNQHQLPILVDVFKFFERINTNVGYAGIYEPFFDINSISKMLSENQNLHNFVEQFITSCDTGVSKIVIKKREGDKNEPIFYPSFVHIIDGKEYSVSAFEESSGTKYLFRTLTDYFLTLAVGGVLVMDEFDLHLHPHILPKLLKLFTDTGTNPKNAQLIFTSHNTRIMDSLGRYRSHIVTKRDNESFVFRLDEIPGDLLRNDRPISPAYDEGKLGGVPRI